MKRTIALVLDWGDRNVILDWGMRESLPTEEEIKAARKKGIAAGWDIHYSDIEPMQLDGDEYIDYFDLGIKVVEV